jgi:hypothetical protein
MGIHKYRVYRNVHCHHVQDCLRPDCDHVWGCRSTCEYQTEIQDLESRMCIERIAKEAPRYVAHIRAIKLQFSEAFVLLEGARDCNDFSVSDLKAARKVQCQALQTTVSAQPIRENGIVNFTAIKLGRALIPYKDLTKYCGCCGACDSAV